MTTKFTDKKTYFKYLLILVGTIIIIFNSLSFVNKNYLLYNVSDEFGYLSNAMYISRGEEQKIASLWGNYYSYGYSILIAPLIYLFDNIDSVYICAVYLNTLFIILAFILSIKCCNYLFKDWSNFLTIIICLSCILFSSNFVYVKWVWPETLVVFLFWLSIYLLIRIEARDDVINKYTFLFITVLAYSYTVHQRTLVMSIAAIISLFYIIFIEKRKVCDNSKIKFVFLCIYTIILLYIIKFSKEIILRNVYGNNIFSSINNMSGIASSVSSKLSIEGCITFLYGLSGKVWYSMVATFFLGGLGIWFCLKKVLTPFYLRKINIHEQFSATYLFILFCFLGSLLLNTIFMWGNYSRHDTLIYGRYMEYTFGGILVCGFYEIYKNKFNKIIRTLLTLIILSFFVAIISAYVWTTMTQNYYKSMFSSAIVGYFFPLPSSLSNIPFLIILIRTNIIVLFLGLINLTKKRKVILLIIALLCSVIWIYNSTRYNESAYNYQNELYQSYAPMKELIQNTNDDQKIYIIYNANDDDENVNEQRKIARLQIMLYDRMIEPIQLQTMNNANIDNCGIYIVSQKAYDISTIEQLLKKYVIVFENNEWIIYKSKDM